MKKKLTAFAAMILLSLVLGIIVGPGGQFLSPIAVKAVSLKDPGVNLPDFSTPAPSTPNPKIVLIPDSPILELFPKVPTNAPISTPKPADPTPKPNNPTPKPNNPTRKPDDKPKGGSGQYMTSEGPLFMSFRADLTDQFYMFTPMDLSVDGEYRFPLIGSSRQVLGEAKVAVTSGMVIVTFLVVNNVKVNENEEFFTFFPDIRGVTSVKPSQLQSVKLRFGIPYSVAGWLNSDPKVLLYINTPVSYKTDLRGLTPFSFEDPGYIQRVIEALALMD